MADSAPERVRVYLRAPLFSLGREGHLPTGVIILTGSLLGDGSGGLRLRAEAYADEKGNTLKGTPRSLIIPIAKVDHLELLEDT